MNNNTNTMNHTVVMFSLLALVTVALKYNVVISKKRQEDYNNFAGDNNLYYIPNFWNVVSNIVFICGGLYQYSYKEGLFGILCALVGIGSAYYHLQPTLDTLLWDRLPMALAFTYLISIKLKLNLWSTTLFLIYGAWTVIYWSNTLDLSFYLSLQIVPIVFFMLYPSYNMRLACFFYIVAKICEDYDNELFSLTNGLFSGHELKHWAAGSALFLI